MSEELKRAIYLLDVVARFIDENPIIGERTIVYDDAECDGGCLAHDCHIAARQLEMAVKA